MNMSESQILNKVSAAFSPYLRTPDELRLIRTQIARHVELLKPQEQDRGATFDQYAIPPYITGISRKYLKALHNSMLVNREYTNLQNQIQSQFTRGADVNDLSSDLQAHLELLRLRKQYQTYQTLSHYLNEAEVLASKDKIFSVSTPHPLPILSSNEADSTELSVLLGQYRELNRNLDVAILQANHQLKRERQLLERLQDHGKVPSTLNSEAKSHTLMSTNAELANWIEEVLAKCDEENEARVSADEHSSQTKDENVDHDKIIEGQYNKYVEARRRLLSAATALSSSQPPSKHKSPAFTDSVTPAETQQAHSRPPDSLITSSLPTVTTIHVPQQNYQQNLAQTQKCMETLLQKERYSLKEQLLRLSDESHLLPSYPLLTKSKKTEPDLDDVDRLLRSWTFAVEAATTATGAITDKQIDSGQKALDEMHETLDGLTRSEKMWQKLDEE